MKAPKVPPISEKPYMSNGPFASDVPNYWTEEGFISMALGWGVTINTSDMTGVVPTGAGNVVWERRIYCSKEKV